MKTAIIYNDCEVLIYYLAEGDQRKYHKVYVNMMEPEGFEPAGEYDMLTDGLWAALDSFTECTFEEFAQSIRDGAFVIECGCLP